ncbi:MAG TPA: glycoside hydrolase family 3 N-terminal domain-containing protein, partial [Gemmatimonadales bacterium]|nr:glycoside hydrolase family 3 N-terminal domain-containing protein [Gemmatimonadales bacterium]
FPQAIGLAATWDTTLMARVAGAIAREAASRGIRQVLSPVVNLADDVRWGRVEETYGEDPLLASTLARAYVAPFAQAGIVATPKHFVANVGEGGRDSYPVDLSERALEERYFPPFKAALDAGAGSVMTAYNSVDGAPATQNPWLLTTTLKQRWGFSGFVISDAAATGGATVLHHTEPNTASAARDALVAGLDVIFQSSYPQHRPYLDAVRRGLIPDSVLDAAVARVLRAKFELGLFEHPYADPDSAAFWNGHDRHRELALEAARASLVLLRNQRGTLPLGRTIRSLAVIGMDAQEARLGGYSGPGVAPVSILAGIRRKFPGARVRYAPGPGRLSPEYQAIPAENLSDLKGEYFDNPSLQGAPKLVRTDPRVDFLWTLSGPAPGIALDWFSARWSGTLRVPPRGLHRLGVAGNDGYRLYLDDRLLLDHWPKQSVGERLAPVSLAPGSTHRIRLEYHETVGQARLRLVWDAGVARDWKTRIDSAVALARTSKVAIVVAGIEEGEFRDRASLALPGHQEELILRVAATGKPVVVILIGGSAVTMTRWIDRVAAVVDAWYPGEQGGNAVADLLAGEFSPAGRLPVSFPLAEGQLPLVYDHKPTGRGDDYLDLSGHPLFPFGFGLSFTSFEYSALRVEPAELPAGGTAMVRCRIRNTGTRAGDEVVQLYVRDLLASLARPVLQLAGFQRLHLDPGEEREVSFALGSAQLALLDRSLHWVVEPGSFRVLIGGSSADFRLRGELVVR